MIPGEIEEIVKRVFEELKPVSVFLYGSQARGDAVEGSDFELGVFYPQAKKISRADLLRFKKDKVSLYPFCYEDFLEYRIDTPFTKNIYIRDLVTTGKTLVGEPVLEKLQPPPIGVIDLLADTRFSMGRALSAVLSARHGDSVGARDSFLKSFLYGARNFLVVNTNTYPISYKDILAGLEKTELGEYNALRSHVQNVRGGNALEESYLYKNLSFLNQVVEVRIADMVGVEVNKLVVN